MANIVALEEILDEIKSSGGITDAILVSRSGMHIAGKAPKGSHSETFVAMSAIMLGAAETSTSELKDKLKIVTIHLEQSKLAMGVVTQKAILVIKAGQSDSDEKLFQVLTGSIPKFQKALQ